MIRSPIHAILVVVLVPTFFLSVATRTDAQRIPHGQDQLPNPARSPQEALEKMTVPEGFRVELVASEPDIVNPIAMTFDERGRVWITESIEYPRRSAGKGRDRIKILEDTDGDGKMDKTTIFAEGLNIPSGIAVGHGGVWVANSPDLLLMRDTDGDDKVDETKVIVTGFGRDDTHELPNSLTWGPDGWLYGLNGVFNHSHVKHCGNEYKFTCAMFRICPRPIESGPWKGQHKFEIFCEGTSNPWGIAFDDAGSAFISACVIDHLWHLTETGYYLRQGGPYPPFTWKIDSIVKHRHQKAAYCGITFFDSDAYPEEYREKLYMGNIHGGCINVDKLSRDGSTYFAIGAPDFMTANDSWFMPVAQKTGPDGCLYVLDWYDRYHCYQDANRDPKGIDRLKGRLYRVRYNDSPRAEPFDLKKETNEQLIQRLASPNIYFRNVAQRLLVERLDAGPRIDALRESLQQLVLGENASRKQRMHAVWTLVGRGPLTAEFHLQLLEHPDPGFRAWGVRAAGNQGRIDEQVRKKILAMVGDPSPDVLLQLAIASRKINDVDPLPILVSVLAFAGNDKLLPKIVWQNLYPLLEQRGDEFLTLVIASELQERPAVANLMPRVTDLILAVEEPNSAVLAQLFNLLIQNEQTSAATLCLRALAHSMQTGQVTTAQIAELRLRLEPALNEIQTAGRDHPLFWDATLVAATWNDPKAIQTAVEMLASPAADAQKVRALNSLIASDPANAVKVFRLVLSDPAHHSVNLRRLAIASMGRLNDPEISSVVLENFETMDSPLQKVAVELLTQRASWSLRLFEAIEQEKISKEIVHLTSIRQMAASNDANVVEGVEKIWGKVRSDRDPQRAEVIDRVRRLVQQDISKANLTNGEALFKTKCAICHTLHGQGEKIGPDITDNGRGSFEQLLSNVLDPNLVIGADYQARVIIKNDGRIITGLLAEDNDRRVVLKMQEGKTETIARRDIDTIKVSANSLMPDNPEQEMSDQELVDLFGFIASDPVTGQTQRKWIPGIRPLSPQDITEPSEYHRILDKFAPGFTTEQVGERGLGIVAEHFGRHFVLRTHPVDRNKPCILRTKIRIPADKQTHLLLGVSYDASEKPSDWQLVVKANGKVLHDSIISENTTIDHWSELSIDLSEFAGSDVELELHNKGNDWSWEFAYWDRIEIVSK